MNYNNTDILFASLVGSKVDIPRFNIVQNELTKHVLPPIPFLPIKNKDEIQKVPGSVKATIWEADAPTPEDQQFFPFYFETADGEKYMLPYEPMISISGGNTIVKRNVAKANGLIGSVKERWSQKDYEITITGVLIGSLLTGSVSECFPIADFVKLKNLMTTPKELKVYCDPLQLLGINRIVIEDFTFPFTKGENVQAYEIKAYSDFAYNLLIDIND